MSFPDDKETFRRVVGKNMPIGQQGDKVKTGDHNNVADFIERLEDILGYNFIDGYADLKAKLTQIISDINSKGDFKADGSVPMTGDLRIEANNKGIKLTSTDPDAEPNFIQFTPIDSVLMKIVQAEESLRMYLTQLEVYGNFYATGYINCDGNGQALGTFKVGQELTVGENGQGMIVNTPDGTKFYRISVNNAGTIISTEVFP